MAVGLAAVALAAGACVASGRCVEGPPLRGNPDGAPGVDDEWVPGFGARGVAVAPPRVDVGRDVVCRPDPVELPAGIVLPGAAPETTPPVTTLVGSIGEADTLPLCPWR
ncbi:MAG: hypothetical protein QOH99_515 [Frankiaceae bacterium]|nr:hypothetical protein [Frankiaceae bacterium]